MSHRSKAFVRLLTVLAVILSLAGFAASHQAAHAAGSSGGYVPVSPQRLASAVSVAGGHYTNVQVVGIPGVPADAVAVDVTVTGRDASTSFLTAYPDTGGQQPFVTTVSLNPNQTVADSAIVAPGPDHKIAIYNNAGNASVYVDLYGYYENNHGAGFQALSPSVRFAGPVTVNAGVPAVIQVGGAHGLPSSGGVIAATRPEPTTPRAATWSATAQPPTTHQQRQPHRRSR